MTDSIYVEIDVDGSREDLWEYTQDPDVHARWDLRFTDIEYLPREAGEPQRFTYRTHVGGVGVAGTGESTGDAETDEEWTSGLVFRSADPRALIRQGNGFWKYRETGAGVEFRTEYDYEPRWGALGRVVDRFAFRPLLGWATAWSFDRLRRWVEDDLAPEDAMTFALVHALARVSLALAWVYQGLVPKLLSAHSRELRLAADVPLLSPGDAVFVLGLAEVALGVGLLAAWRRRWLLLVAGALPVALTFAASVRDATVLAGPFNPVATTVAMLALGVAGYLVSDRVPTARTCRRERS